MVYVTKVEYLKGYCLHLTFSDGVQKVVDLKEDIFSDTRAPMQKLRELSYFQSVQVDEDIASICWSNGVDFAPHYLYKKPNADLKAVS